MTSEKVSYPVLIREAHLDTFGHVNNARYLDLFEEARWECMTQRGYGLEKVRSSGLGPIILEVQLKFILELHLRKQITITTQVLKYEKKIGILRQEMLDTDGHLCAQADFTFGLFDLRERKLVLPTTEWKLAIGISE